MNLIQLKIDIATTEFQILLQVLDLIQSVLCETWFIKDFLIYHFGTPHFLLIHDSLIYCLSFSVFIIPLYLPLPISQFFLVFKCLQSYVLILLNLSFFAHSIQFLFHPSFEEVFDLLQLLLLDRLFGIIFF